jgi:hypothetical protein
MSTPIYAWVTDSDRYATLETLDEADLDLFIDGFAAQPMAENWLAPAVRLRPDEVRRGNPPGDFASLFGGVPILGRRAVDVLGAELEPHGELLPLEDDYWAFNVLTLADVLDAERSEGDWFAPGRMSNLRRLVTRDDLADPLPAIFKLPQWRKGRPLITAELVEEIERHGLTGLAPQQVGAA